MCDNRRRPSFSRAGAVRHFRERALSVTFEYGRRPSGPRTGSVRHVPSSLSTGAARHARHPSCLSTGAACQVWEQAPFVMSRRIRERALSSMSEYGRRPSCLSTGAARQVREHVRTCRSNVVSDNGRRPSCPKTDTIRHVRERPPMSVRHIRSWRVSKPRACVQCGVRAPSVMSENGRRPSCPRTGAARHI